MSCGSLMVRFFFRVAPWTRCVDYRFRCADMAARFKSVVESKPVPTEALHVATILQEVRSPWCLTYVVG